MTDSYRTIEVKREQNGAVWLTLNRPERLNAIDQTLVDELHAFLGSIENDPRATVLVLRGAGRAFCAGLDLKDPAGDPSGEGDGSISSGLRAQRHMARLVIRVRHLPQPVIALVHGPATGGGFALALAADVRIAGESARMNAAFIRLGLSACDLGTSYFLPRIVGLSLASELLLTGKFIDARRSLESGLVSRIVPDDGLEAAGRELAAEMARNAPLSLRLTKECLLHNVDAGSLEAAIAMEDRNQVLATRSPNVLEGMRAFLEKRDPDWPDR